MTAEVYLTEHGPPYFMIVLLIYTKSLQQEQEVHFLHFYFEPFVMALNAPHREFLQKQKCGKEVGQLGR